MSRTVGPTRRVTIGVTASAVQEGDLALGILDYGSRCGHWQFVGDSAGPFTRFSDLDPAEIDGVIGYFYGNAYTRKSAEAVAAARVAGVNISNSTEDIPLPRLSSDEEAIGRLGAEHLLERGFTHFAFVKQGSTWYSQRRMAAFREVVEADSRRSFRSLTARRLRVMTEPERLRRWLDGLLKPLAVMTATDVLARHVVTQAGELGLRVPADVAVLGVDNNQWEDALSTTPISSIEHDLWRIGHEAAALLDRLMDGAAPPAVPRWIAPIGVVPRASTDVVLTEDPVVGRALEFIRAHCTRGISVDDVLDAIGISRRTLEMQMKRATGQTPKAAISRAKIERAKQRLVDGDNTMARIARDCGFPSDNRFFIVFKRFTGMTPGQYRQRYGSPR